MGFLVLKGINSRFNRNNHAKPQKAAPRLLLTSFRRAKIKKTMLNDTIFGKKYVI
jgi:hypothetical protein